MKVVIFKLNNLGDNVVFVPAVQALRERCPDWQITLVTTPTESELYQGPLGPQEILTSRKRAFNKSHLRPWVLASWIGKIRQRHPDACLLAFDQGSASHLVARLSGARTRIGGNVADLTIPDLLTENIPIPEDGRPVTWNWRMARALARLYGRGEGWPEDPPPPDLRHLSPAGGRPRGNRARVVIHAGASKYLNQWSPENFATVASSLSRDYEVVWIEHGGTTGTAPEGALAAPVRSLAELAEWLVGADLFLGNNSGPMHLANALGCPGVAVTGPSAMGWDPYWHREHWTVLRHPNLACSPCEVPNREIAGCANLGSPMACLKYWKAEMVESACRSRLEAQEGQRR